MVDFVEQMSIVGSKDPLAPVATLTPTLHSDTYYGVREAAITSMLEKGWDGHGGAMFMPLARMDRFEALRPITVQMLIDRLQEEVFVLAGAATFSSTTE